MVRLAVSKVNRLRPASREGAFRHGTRALRELIQGRKASREARIPAAYQSPEIVAATAVLQPKKCYNKVLDHRFELAAYGGRADRSPNILLLAVMHRMFTADFRA
jgi:hypothetical protein